MRSYFPTISVWWRAALLVILGTVLACAGKSAMAAEPYVIGAVFDVTGPGSPLGTPERDTALMLENQINARGGINGHPVKLVIYDNQSDESQSVLAVKKLIESNKVLAIIGPSQTGTTLAAAETINAAGVPFISCAAGVKIVNPVKPWIFKTAQSDVHAVAKVLDYLKAHKLTRVAFISVSNAFGDSGKAQMAAQCKGARVNVIDWETFGDKDTDMTAQLLKIRSMNPQAIVCWGTNPGPAQVAKNMRMLGMKQQLIMSHGIANKKFIELAGPAAEGVVFPAGHLIVAKDIPNSDPQKKTLMAYEAGFEAKYGREADTFGGHAYDAFNLVCQALKKVGPDRAKIRAELERTHHFVGIGGVFNFSPADHNGLGKDAFVMVRIHNGQWTLER